MAGNSVISRMTMRATVQRDGAGTDAWNNKAAPSYAAHIASQRCYVWIQSSANVDDVSKSASLNDHMMMVPIGTDIVKTDRITTVKDRSGTEIFSGTFEVMVSPKRMPTHLEIEMRRIDG